MKNGRAVLCTVLTVLWTIFIFYNSTVNSTDSTAGSDSVLNIVNKLLGDGVVSSLFIRKMAHFVEYFVLGILLMRTVWEYKKVVMRVITVPLFLGLFTAVCDETIQLFSAGRSGQVSDIIIDFAGAFIGILITGLILAKR